jgi:hypothetical protein
VNMHEEFEDTKGVIRIRKSKKDRQHNGQKKKDKQRLDIYSFSVKYSALKSNKKTGCLGIRMCPNGATCCVSELAHSDLI